MPITVLQKPFCVKHYSYYGIILLFVLTVHAEQGENATKQESPKAESSISPPPSATQTLAENANAQKPEGPVQQPKGTEQESGSSDERVTRAERIQIGINAVMFLVVLAQTVIYMQQRNIMRKQVEHARIAERAYIGIERVVTELHAIGQQPVVRVTVLNGGRTPAYRLKLPGHLTLTRARLTYPHERPESSEKASESFLPAGSKTTFSYPFPSPLAPWTAELAKAIATEEYFLYLHIEAQFDDVWGDKHVQPFKLLSSSRQKMG